MKINIKNSSNVQVGIKDNKLGVEIGVQRIKGGGSDYRLLDNLPSINNVVLIDNKTLDDLNIQIKGEYPEHALTNSEIEELLDNFV